MKRWTGIGGMAALALILVLAAAENVSAHCDTLEAKEKKAHAGESVEAGRAPTLIDSQPGLGASELLESWLVDDEEAVLSLH